MAHSSRKRSWFGGLFAFDWHIGRKPAATIRRKQTTTLRVQPLEDRAMLAPLVLTMQTAPFSDSISIQLLESNHSFIRVHDNFFGTNTLFDRATFDSVLVQGTAGKVGPYFLTLNFAHGNFLNTLTAGGFAYNMDVNSNFEIGNTLNIEGNPPFNSELQTPDPGIRCNGSIVLDANPAINYFGVPNINDTLVINGTATYQGYLASSLASENVNIVDGSIAGTSQINDGRPLPTANLSQINFANKPLVVVDARDGFDSVNVNNPAGAVGVNRLTIKATGGGGDTYHVIQAPPSSTILRLEGGSGANTLAVDDPDFVINGANSGFVVGGPVFVGMASLVGGIADDTFTFTNTGSLTGTIDGGGTGPNGDTIIGNGLGNAFNITGANAGNIVALLPAGFTKIQNLTGGAADDTFTFATGGVLAGKIDGGGVSASGNKIVGDNAARTYTISGVNAGSISTILVAGFTRVQNLTGGTAGDTFNFLSAGVLDGVAAGGAGDDTFIVDNGAGLAAKKRIVIDGGDGKDTLRLIGSHRNRPQVIRTSIEVIKRK